MLNTSIYYLKEENLWKCDGSDCSDIKKSTSNTDGTKYYLNSEN